MEHKYHHPQEVRPHPKSRETLKDRGEINPIVGIIPAVIVGVGAMIGEAWSMIFNEK